MAFGGFLTTWLRARFPKRLPPGSLRCISEIANHRLLQGRFLSHRFGVADWLCLAWWMWSVWGTGEGRRLGQEGFGIEHCRWGSEVGMTEKCLKLAWKTKCPAWWSPDLFSLGLVHRSVSCLEEVWNCHLSPVFKRCLKCGSRKHLRGCWAGPCVW